MPLEFPASSADITPRGLAGLQVGHVVKNNPLETLAILLCLATMLYCILLVYRHRNQLDRSLITLLGVIAAYQILRVIKDAGFAFEQLRGFDITINLLVSSLCLAAAMVLRISCADRNSTKVQLRLVEANEKTVSAKIPSPQAPAELSAAMVDASPLAMFTVDSHGRVNSWNGAAERLLGWTRKEVLGAQPPVSIANPGPTASTLSFKDRSGQEKGAAAWSVPLREDSGGKRGYLTVLVPLTDLRDVGPGLLTH